MPLATFACLVSIFWPLIDVFLRVYLNIYYASDSVSFIMSTQPNHAIKTTIIIASDRRSEVTICEIDSVRSVLPPAVKQHGRPVTTRLRSIRDKVTNVLNAACPTPQC